MGLPDGWRSWDIPGGFLNEREEPVDGLQREFEAETGLHVEVDAFLRTLMER